MPPNLSLVPVDFEKQSLIDSLRMSVDDAGLRMRWIAERNRRLAAWLTVPLLAL